MEPCVQPRSRNSFGDTNDKFYFPSITSVLGIFFLILFGKCIMFNNNRRRKEIIIWGTKYEFKKQIAIVGLSESFYIQYRLKNLKQNIHYAFQQR